MDEQRLQQLNEQYEQMVRLRGDISLLSGFTFNTVAGDISIENPRKAAILLDYYIKELQDELIHEKG